MLSALDDKGAESASATDWWFMYKLPEGVEASRATSRKAKESKLSGYNYLYYGAGQTEGLRLSPHLLGCGGGALFNTLDAVFKAAGEKSSSTGWLLYNDEKPLAKENDETKGHCKGVLAFDKVNDQGVWLLHSTPRFPVAGQALFPVDERIYAQTYIAITLDGYEAADRIAAQLRTQQNPQVYSYQLPDGAGAISEADNIYQLCRQEPAPVMTEPNEITFKSRAGTEFRSIAKSRSWDKDFWIDLVGPQLEINLAIETWRRGKIPTETDSDQSHSVEDVSSIDLTALGIPACWPYTKDHAKWAVEEKQNAQHQADWVCVADINRQVSQEKRGGGAICFRDQALWEGLASIENYPTG